MVVHIKTIAGWECEKKSQMQPWCNTISSTGAIGTTSASTDTYKSSISSSSRRSNNGTTPFSTSTTSATSATTSSSTTPGGSAEKNMASATMVQLLNKLLHPAPRLKYYSSNLMVCENRNVKSIL